MKASEAKNFENGRSTKSETILTMAASANGCECAAYIDWFTYDRWQAQGLQVQKGEKGTCLQVFRSFEKTNEKTGKVEKGKRPWRSYVFCRCQVAEKGV